MFDDDKLYLTDDPALKVLGSYSTLSHWRLGAGLCVQSQTVPKD